MHRIIDWFVHNPVAANLMMLILVTAGLLALPRTHQEEFPNIEVDAVQVQVPYLGAAPEEVALRSFVASLALFDAFVEATGRPQSFALKWPNDVLIAVVDNEHQAADAVAAGADYAFLGRPFSYAIAANGKYGLTEYADNVTSDISIALAQLGLNDIGSVSKESLCKY